MGKNMNSKIIKIINSIRPEIEFPAGEDITLLGVLDSLDIILLVEELEATLGITIGSEQIVPENFSSLNSLESFIVKLA